MNLRLASTALLALLVASPAWAQGFQGQASTGTGFSGSAQPFPSFQPYQPKPLDNIGRDGQFIFGIERVTGLFFDRQTLTYTDQETNEEYEHRLRGTTFGLLGVDSASPSALPRFALDYVIFGGLTVGGSFVLSTRGLSLDGATGQPPVTPPTLSHDGVTFLLAGRGGFAYAFDETFGIWPRVGLGYASSSAESEVLDPTTGESAGGFEYRSHFATVNAEFLGVLSPIEHIALLAGPYLDYGIIGRYSVTQDGDEIDARDTKALSFGVAVHAVGYY